MKPWMWIVLISVAFATGVSMRRLVDSVPRAYVNPVDVTVDLQNKGGYICAYVKHFGDEVIVECKPHADLGMPFIPSE